MIVLRKTQVKMKTFAPPFFNRFCQSLNKKQACGNKRHDQETRHIHASAPIQYILYQNRKPQLVQMPTLQNTKREKQILFVAEKQMQCLLLQLKSRSAREASRHLAFIGNCPNISHTCQPYLPCRRVLLFVSGVTEQNKDT